MGAMTGGDHPQSADNSFQKNLQIRVDHAELPTLGRGLLGRGSKNRMERIDPNFSNDLCPNDLDRVSDVLEGAFARMPALMEAGIYTIVNGPIT